MFGVQLRTPVAVMTSAAKGNHARVTALCAREAWFGRGAAGFRLFQQALVPVVGVDTGALRPPARRGLPPSLGGAPCLPARCCASPGRACLPARLPHSSRTSLPLSFTQDPTDANWTAFWACLRGRCTRGQHVLRGERRAGCRAGAAAPSRRRPPAEVRNPRHSVTRRGAMAGAGKWLMEGPGAPSLKPGGHGVIWKLAQDEGVLTWLEARGVVAGLVRQISNPMASTDVTLMALAGVGFQGKRRFGFASCDRVMGAAEGMNVRHSPPGTPPRTASLPLLALHSSLPRLPLLPA